MNITDLNFDCLYLILSYIPLVERCKLRLVSSSFNILTTKEINMINTLKKGTLYCFSNNLFEASRELLYFSEDKLKSLQSILLTLLPLRILLDFSCQGKRFSMEKLEKNYAQLKLGYFDSCDSLKESNELKEFNRFVKQNQCGKRRSSKLLNKVPFYFLCHRCTRDKLYFYLILLISAARESYEHFLFYFRLFNHLMDDLIIGKLVLFLENKEVKKFLKNVRIEMFKRTVSSSIASSLTSPISIKQECCACHDQIIIPLVMSNVLELA